MNWLNHFLFSYTLLLLFMKDLISNTEIIIFTIIFALFLDLDFLPRKYILKDKKATRTFIQEPFGLIIIGLTLGLIFSYFGGIKYLGLVLIPYASHIFLDYITIHKVYALAPFSKKEYQTGFIEPVKPNYQTKKGKFNENHFFILNLIFFLLI